MTGLGNITPALPVVNGGRALGVPARFSLGVAAAAVALACLAYLPFVSLPFLPEDLLQVELAEKFTASGGGAELAADPLYRSRATSMFFTHWLWMAFGPSPAAFNIAGILLHCLNIVLVYLLGSWTRIGWWVAGFATLSFAVLERHHEAVVWFAACAELLVFTFCLLTILAWIRWLQEERRLWWWASLALSGLALFSKESGVVIAPLCAAVALVHGVRWNLTALRLAPHALLTAVYVWGIFTASSGHYHFQDGTFSLGAPFLSTMLGSAWRGVLGPHLLLVAAALVWGWRRWRGLLILAGVWIALALLPYSFLTYMPRIPSRHHYLSSVGVALLMATGMWAVLERVRWRIAAGALALGILGFNLTYLWVYKHPQFVQRAAALQGFVDFMKNHDGRPVELACFPHDATEARRSSAMLLGKPDPISLAALGPAAASRYCAGGCDLCSPKESR
ncbi:MAG: hypothetical protein FJW40_01525 [Acidobacteria bacterium]|nr:hypothetical protein [Acidobacteriota bacterium]